MPGGVLLPWCENPSCRQRCSSRDRLEGPNLSECGRLRRAEIFPKTGPELRTVKRGGEYSRSLAGGNDILESQFRCVFPAPERGISVNNLRMSSTRRRSQSAWRGNGGRASCRSADSVSDGPRALAAGRCSSRRCCARKSRERETLAEMPEPCWDPASQLLRVWPLGLGFDHRWSPLAFVRLQHFLAQTQGLWRYFDEFVVGDEFDGLFQI